MKQPLHVDPAIYDRTVREAISAHTRGNAMHAMTLAMTAGVDAGLLGHELSECPFNKPGFLDMQLQWNWGRGQAVKANDNREQRRLL